MGFYNWQHIRVEFSFRPYRLPRRFHTGLASVAQRNRASTGRADAMDVGMISHFPFWTMADALIRHPDGPDLQSACISGREKDCFY